MSICSWLQLYIYSKKDKRVKSQIFKSFFLTQLDLCDTLQMNTFSLLRCPNRTSICVKCCYDKKINNFVFQIERSYLNKCFSRQNLSVNILYDIELFAFW